VLRTTARASTLKLSVKMRCASLNSGVEKERRGSSFLRISSSCKAQALNTYHYRIYGKPSTAFAAPSSRGRAAPR